MYDINHQVWAAHLLCRSDRGEEPSENSERLGSIGKNVTDDHRKTAAGTVHPSRQRRWEPGRLLHG
jgi:hypothetical protein